MININNEVPEGVWADPEVLEHSNDENTEGLSLEQSQELLIKDLQIAREKLLLEKTRFTMDGEPEDQLGKETYKNTVARFDSEIAKIDEDLKELGVVNIAQ